MGLHRLAAFVFALLIVMPLSAKAQTPPPTTPPVASSDQLLKPEELDALVAPIALYPDTLLSLALMASTYPLEVVQADRWVKENKNLKGDQLKDAVDKQSWDESVKSLVATPDLLSMMSTKLTWTMKLGDAVLAQQPDVMDAVQRLRTKADANKKLTSTKQQKVTKTQQQGKQIIAIEPTDPNTVYVPYYDPSVVYGGWPYPAYPPYYFGYPGYIAGGIIATGLAFGAGYALGRWASGGNYWGGNVNWTNNNINVNRPRTNPGGGNNWQHRPEHRQGVRYNNSLAFGRSSVTIISAVAVRTAWIFAAAVAIRVSGPAAVSDLAQGNCLRVDVPVRGSGLRVVGAVQDSAPRVDVPVRGSGLRVVGAVQDSAPRADVLARGSGRRVDEAAAMPSAT